ncbi:hypothetical protein SLE2022_157920 [Rubroshorea leprosula]
MGENLRRNIPILSLVTEACMCEFTRTNSDFSGFTVESSRDRAGDAELGQSMVWTDEKHNLYLDLLEASFVKQLHRSMSFCGWHSGEEMQDPSSQPVAREHNSSDQFMVLQDSCRQKINIERNETLLDSTADSTDILESPWIHYSASAGEHYSTMSAHPQEKMVHGKGMHSRSNMDLCVSAKISRQHHECYSCKQSFSGSSAEASGQNFEDENQGAKTNSVSRAKRLKAATVDASSSDQVVPLGNFHLVDKSTIIEADTSSKRGKKKLLSEQPESFSKPQSDMHYFLRGS